MKITCCRRGKYPNINSRELGAFQLSFSNLSSLAKFIVNSPSLYFPLIRKELSRKEYSILMSKTRSLSKRLLPKYLTYTNEDLR